MRNDRYLFVPTQSRQYSGIKTINDLGRKLIDEIKSFFKQYNQLEGKKFDIIKQVTGEGAFTLIKKSYE